MGISALRFLFDVLSVVAALTALGCLLVTVGVGKGPNPVANITAPWWQHLSRLSFKGALRHGVRAVPAKIAEWATLRFARLDRSSAFSAGVLVLLLVVVPAAALVNGLTGGSWFVLKAYGLIAICLISLGLFGGLSWTAPLMAVCAVLAPMLFFGVVPLRLFRSFADRALTDAVGNGLMLALIAAPFLGVFAWGCLAFFEAGIRRRAPDSFADRIGVMAATGAAALVPSYLFVHVAAAVGHRAVFGLTDARSWPMMLLGVAGAAISAALTAGLLAAPNRRSHGVVMPLALALLGAVVLTVAIAFLVPLWEGRGDVIGMAVQSLLGLAPQGVDAAFFLDGAFWIVHLPLLPPVLTLAFGLAAGLGKLLLVPVGDGLRPQLAAPLSIAWLVFAAALLQISGVLLR